MKNMTAEKIATALGLELRGDNVYDDEVKGVVYDSRLVKEGYVFIAIKGNRVDGHTLVNDAYKSGAVLAIVEQEGDYNGAYILVESTKKALGQIAAYYRKQLDIPIVGIIGSVGKTTTKEMTASVLSRKYNVLKTQGNFNNDMGLPITILSIKEEHTAAVVEMGISEFGEMDYLGSIARPDVVVFTCIGECHLENLKDRDGVFKAKTEVLKYLNDNATVIINADDDKLINITKDTLREDVSLLSYSARPKDSGEGATYQVEEITNLGLEGYKVNYTKDRQGEVVVPLPGEHNVSNAMSAIAVGFALGESAEQVAEGIAMASTISGRNNFIEKSGVTIIDDCYNANPMSMRAGLGILGLAKGRKIAVLGDMGELGQDELSLHKELYKSVIENKIDIVFTAGELSSSIVKAIKEDPAGDRTIAKSYIGDDAKDQIINELISLIRKDDTILVKASHFMDFEKIVQELSAHLEG